MRAAVNGHVGIIPFIHHFPTLISLLYTQKRLLLPNPNQPWLYEELPCVIGKSAKCPGARKKKIDFKYPPSLLHTHTHKTHREGGFFFSLLRLPGHEKKSVDTIHHTPFPYRIHAIDQWKPLSPSTPTHTLNAYDTTELQREIGWELSLLERSDHHHNPFSFEIPWVAFALRRRSHNIPVTTHLFASRATSHETRLNTQTQRQSKKKTSPP